MVQVPDYVFDSDRLAALADYAILDTPAEPGFDDIVHLAAQICDVPVALVSLVSADRQWFKARVGFEPCETSLDSSVCAHALDEPDLLVIPDLTQDKRTKTNPLVMEAPHIRFYAGAPFRGSSGQVLGSLCVIDSKARPDGLTAAQASGLRNLARQVTSQMDLRRAIAERDALVAEQRAAERRRTGLLLLGDRLRAVETVSDMTRAASAIVGEALSITRAAFGRFDPSTEYLIVEPDWTADGVTSVAGRHRLDDYGDLRDSLVRGNALIVEDIATDPRTIQKFGALVAFNIRSFVNLPVRHHGQTVAVLLVHDSKPRIWSSEVMAFLRNVADRLEVGIARLEAEAEQQTLNHELSHRLKNTFAMIQAIAMQTLRPVADQAPVEVFINRLHALSQAHDVLLEKNWLSAEIRTVIFSVLDKISDKTRFDVMGQDQQVGAKATLALSLLLHELTTNAMKYGSLSNQTGRVAVSWKIVDRESHAEFVLTWAEVGGPVVTTPTRRGFGSKLIRMGLSGSGGVELRYLSTGLEAELRAPLAQMELS